MRYFFWIACFFLPISVPANDIPFQNGEELKYDIYYKYGLVMLKAGTANYKVVDSHYLNKNSYKSSLDFKTTSFFDKIIKIRDTLFAQISDNLHPLYHIRIVNEGNTNFREEMFYHRFGAEYSEVRVRREKQQVLKFDTVLFSDGVIYDIMNLIPFIRSRDYSQMEYGQKTSLSTFVGREKVTVNIRYDGQSVVEKSKTLKYNTYKLVLDITDRVFNESKNAMEIWISNDKNHIPVKIKAKLKIGAAEVNLNSWENLKHPLSSEIKIPFRKN